MWSCGKINWCPNQTFWFFYPFSNFSLRRKGSFNTWVLWQNWICQNTQVLKRPFGVKRSYLQSPNYIWPITTGRCCKVIGGHFCLWLIWQIWIHFETEKLKWWGHKLVLVYVIHQINKRKYLPFWIFHPNSLLQRKEEIKCQVKNAHVKVRKRLLQNHPSVKIKHLFDGDTIDSASLRRTKNRWWSGLVSVLSSSNERCTFVLQHFLFYFWFIQLDKLTKFNYN